MQYDKYGDPIDTKPAELSPKAKKAFALLAAIQLLLILLNVVVLAVPSLNLYLCFITAPIYLFMYVNFLKGYSHQKDLGIEPAYCKIISILSPMLYCLTAVLAVFSGM